MGGFHPVYLRGFLQWQVRDPQQTGLWSVLDSMTSERSKVSQLLVDGDRTVVAEYFDEHGRIRDPVPRPALVMENCSDRVEVI